MEYVALTFDGCYLHLVTGPDGSRLRADGTELDATSVFERLDLLHGRVALRTNEGRYLTRHRREGDTGAVLRPLDDLSSAAAFEELPAADGSVSLRSCDLLFVGVETGGEVVVDRVSNGSWERFAYVSVDAELASAWSDAPRVPSEARVPRQAGPAGRRRPGLTPTGA